MRRRTFLAAAPAIALGTRAAMAAGPLHVMASFSVLGDMVRQVGGGAVSVETLVGPNADVHIYEPTPRDLRNLLACQVLVRNGLGLEGWMDRLADAAGYKGHVVVAAAKVVPQTMREAGGPIATDPHAWQNPRNGVLYATSIADGLGMADAARADAFRTAAAGYAQRIEAMDRWIAAQFAPIPTDRRRIITTHDAFGYYGARYGIQFLAAEGISTEDQPSAAQIATLIRQIKREKVPAVFIENMTSPRMARMLAQETGAKLGGTVYSDALSQPDGPAATYLDMLHYNTTLFVQAMQGEA